MYALRTLSGDNETRRRIGVAGGIQAVVQCMVDCKGSEPQHAMLQEMAMWCLWNVAGYQGIMYMHMYVCIYVYIYLQCTYIHMYVCMYIYTFVYMYVHVCMYVCIHTHKRYIHTYIYVLCVYIIPWYTHTHTHTHREPRTLVAEQMYLGMPRCYARTRVVAWGSGAGLLAPCVCLLRWCAFSFFFWFLVCVGSLCVSGPCVCLVLVCVWSLCVSGPCVCRVLVCVGSLCMCAWCFLYCLSLFMYR
jgi:hypothetical protein